MATTKKSTSKKATTKKSASLALTKTEGAALAKKAEAEAKKRGFKSVDEYIAYIDKKRGY